jgi:hypothetical protein
MEELADPAGALRSCQQAVVIWRRLAEEAPGSHPCQHHLAVSQEKLEDLTSRLMSPATPEPHETPRLLH